MRQFAATVDGASSATHPSPGELGSFLSKQVRLSLQLLNIAKQYSKHCLY